MNGGLGREQAAAAAIGRGSVRVVAGAGTGKTAVIAERFRRLVATGVSPSSILVMTFTERAAAEMRQRIEDLVAQPAPSVGTFHSMALGWLRADGRAVGVPSGFRIVAGADRWILTRELMWSIGDVELTGDERPDDLVAPLLQMLERLKQELVPLQRLEAWAASSDDPERAGFMRAALRLFRAYEKECRKRRFLDFDDLLLLAVRMLESSASLLRDYAARYPHVLVDEYQDLNLAQERLVELIAREGEPFVVGDDDQSIYRFRGASRASLERFLKSFPGARTITLGRNRRSSRRIVAAASALIESNPDRLPKQLRSEQAGPEVQVWACPDGTAEAYAIASEAAALVEGGTSPSAIAVLCRTNAIARPMVAALSALGLPHAVTGGHGFHDRPEVKDVVALLRVLRDPADVVALARALARPPANLDQAAVLNVLRDRGPGSALEALRAWPPAATLAGQLERFAAAAHRFDVRDLFFELMETTGYLEVLNASLDAGEAARATANVSRFAEAIAEFCEESPDHSLENYMRHLDLVLLSGEDEEPAAPDGPQEAIQVMTIHQAKGLEFDVVFVPSLVEGRLPQSGRSPRFELPPAVLEPLVRGREDVLAEERRLLYVAMTRARKSLHLTWGAHYEGGRRWRESRFLQEVRTAGARTVRERAVEGCPATATAKPTMPRAGEVQLSYSAIAAYLDCPRQYWYRYEQRLPAVQSAEAVHGVILHDVLRRAGEIRREGGAVNASRLRSILAEVWSTTAFPDERRAPTFRRNGAAQLEAYRKKGGLDAVPAYLEHPFQVEVDGWTLRGVIDRIDRTALGWSIVDYKSGRPVARRKRDLQLALYALGATSALAIEPVELEVVYLASGETVRIERPGALLGEARTESSRAAEGIRAGRFDARPDRRRCRLCAYRLACADAL
ncbi:MAG TPA: ATP-dependent DNA helicase [Candidatus Dormibacteraeota bacterium]|nr:ATP-dependent DNA helicase [Candidatus Dormibacteraeota bacterium]